MMPRVTLLGALAAACAAGCGGTTPAPATAPAAEVADDVIDIRAFAFSEPGMMAYLKAREVAALPGYADWLEVHPQAQRAHALFGELRRACEVEPFEVIDEVLFTVVDDQLIGAMRVRLGEEAVFACLERLIEGGTRTEIAGKRALRAPDEPFVLTLVDDILVFGDELTVADRIRSHEAYDGRISPALPDLRHLLAYARAGADEGAVNAVESRFTKEGEQLELSVRMRSPSPEDADWVVNAIRDALSQEVDALLAKLPEEARPRAQGVLERAAIHRRVGQSVEIAMPVDVLSEGQILMVALVDRLGDAMLRREEIDRARMLIEIMGIRLQAHAEEHPRGGRPAFPASAPLTPSAPLSGLTGSPMAADWSHPTWKALGFEPPIGLTHAYAIETAPGGRSTVVRAVADLDEDGEPSTLELPLTLDGEKVVVGTVTRGGDTE